MGKEDGSTTTMHSRGDVSVVDALPVSDFEPSYYNALVFVSPSGQMLAHYRKTFLYYTDEIWASENTDGFFSGDLPFRAPKLTNARQTRPSSISDACGDGGAEMKVAAGICMDINPYQFKAPWTAYEFASHCIRSQARLVVLSMAWLTRLPAEAIEMDQHNPDWNTVGYWIERFAPLLTHKSDNVHYETRQDETTHGKSSNEQAPQQRGDKESKEQVIVIFANRTGFEGTAPLIGDVRYAGSSAVMSMTRPQTRNEGGEIGMWDILGRGVEDVLVVDTEEDPKYGLKMRQKADDSGDEDTSEDSNEVLDV
ncbi:putative protein n-terminal asparagine [Phaeomoniella chlamydospora]|uniref:CN hydrolase domain-containing protein n=1 Tax=Phaeomoniella chlamydospora TaxID=158046 RepID=A0A0G2E879_PHACM|nr:putative protein n-terminal asparagine [Phaeomoniella chlamydospora]